MNAIPCIITRLLAPLLLILLILLTLTPSYARGDDIESGNYILGGCTALASTKVPKASIDRFYECGGALKAVLQLLQMDGKVCPGGHVTIQQGAKIITRYMETHPADLNTPFATLFATALEEAWPCNK